jgi:7-cyano-7-deazaguanine synthase
MERKAVLLSGGLDSAALAFWQRPVVAYTIDYGQSAAVAEIAAAALVAGRVGCEHIVLSVNARQLGCGAMVGTPQTNVSSHEEWWPFRNQLLLTLAGMHAVQNSINTLMIGTVCSDNRHADGSNEFLAGINGLMSLQEGALRISAPARQLSTVELIAQSGLPPSAMLQTHSCHRGNSHCCACPGCRKRMQIFDHFSLLDS